MIDGFPNTARHASSEKVSRIAQLFFVTRQHVRLITRSLPRELVESVKNIILWAEKEKYPIYKFIYI